MSPADLLPADCGLTVTDVAVAPDLVLVAVTSDTPTSRCPACGQPSDRVHSRYQRTLADLPVSGRRFVLRVVLRVAARRFVCGHPGCGRAVFCERLPALAAPTPAPPVGWRHCTGRSGSPSAASPAPAWPRNSPPRPAGTPSCDG